MYVCCWGIYKYTSIYPDVLYFCEQDTIVIVPPYPYCIEEDHHDVPLEECWFARPQLFFKCYLRPKNGRLPRNGTYKAGPGIYKYILVHHSILFLTIAYQMISCTVLYSSTPLRSWICPSRDQWRNQGWSSCTNHPQHRVCTWLLQKTWWAESPSCRCFWLVTPLLRSLTYHDTASAGIQVSRWAALTQQRWTAGVAAMSMRLTRGCGSLGVASHAWVVCQLRWLKKGRRLPGLISTSVEVWLFGGARRIEPDANKAWLWTVYLCIY